MVTHRIALLLLSALAVLLCVAGFPTPSTPLTARDDTPATPYSSNAERLARGLKPNEPRTLYDPSRTRALVPRTSNVATTKYYLEITLASDPGTAIGYVTTTTKGALGLTTTLAAADVYYAPSNLPATRAEISTTSINFPTYTYIYALRGTTDSDGAGVYTFSLIKNGGSVHTNAFDISDFPDPQVTLDYVSGTISEQFDFYYSATNNQIYSGASPASINSAYSQSVTAADQIYIYFIEQ